MTVRIIGRQQVDRDHWDAFANASDEAWLWHRYDLQDALASWPGSRDESFALDDEEEGLVGLVPLRRITRRTAGLVTVHILDSLGGVALRNRLGDKARRRLLQTACERLKERAQHGICLDVRLTLPAMAPGRRGASVPRVNPLLTMGCRNALTQTWVVDLSGGRDAIWMAMEGRARTAVRKAEKFGVTVRAAEADDLDTYYRLHLETYSRSGLTPHPRRYFELIWRHFLSSGLARVWIAMLDGAPIAAENFGIYKQAAIYWTGAASAKGLEVEANSLLQWTAMQWMMDNDVCWYETGEGFPQVGAGKSKGLNDFKKSFGGEMYPYYKGNLPIGRLPERIYRAIQAYRQ
jgi:hypothetical protein